MRRLIIVLVAFLGVVGTAEAQVFGRHRAKEAAPKATAAPEKVFPIGVTWVLQAIGDKPAGTGDPPSFAIDSTLRARGFSGCNSFSMAFYPVKNQSLASGAIAVTRKVCAPETMLLERTFLVALHSLPRWDVRADGDLMLTAGRTALRFRRGV